MYEEYANRHEASFLKVCPGGMGGMGIPPLPDATCLSKEYVWYGQLSNFQITSDHADILHLEGSFEVRSSKYEIREHVRTISV